MVIIILENKIIQNNFCTLTLLFPAFFWYSFIIERIIQNVKMKIMLMKVSWNGVLKPIASATSIPMFFCRAPNKHNIMGSKVFNNVKIKNI